MLQKAWFVFYTKSRQEKKVYELLEKNGYEAFLPLQKVMRQWSDRKKKVEVPLFNSYIFIHDSEHNIPEILKTPGIAWNIKHNNKPAILYPKEIEAIRRFLDTGLFVEIVGYENFGAGDRVEVVDGPLKGLTGVLTQAQDGKKFSVAMEVIGQVMQVKINPGLLKKLD